MSATTVTSPPPSVRPASSPVLDTRDRLNQLAHSLSHARDVRLLREYLRLRSAVRF